MPAPDPVANVDGVAVALLPHDDQYVLNHCTKYLAREDFDRIPPNDLSARICESWRFPIIDSHAGGDGSVTANRVTFVYAAQGSPDAREVAVLGTFAPLYVPIPLRRVQWLGADTRYWACSLVVSHNEVHTYRFVVDGVLRCDPLNPQRVRLDNNRLWSRFFTDYCTQPLTLSRTEAALLRRITEHVLPFRTRNGQRFLDGQTEPGRAAGLEGLDEPVGVVNFIDNILARQEHHHRIDYTICLRLMEQVLRRRHGDVHPCDLDASAFVTLHAEMAGDRVDGWDYTKYEHPRYFLQLLRRQVFTGAFSHPRYGGNVQAAGWAYLAERYTSSDGRTLFDWQRAIEPPLGLNPDYRG